MPVGVSGPFLYLAGDVIERMGNTLADHGEHAVCRPEAGGKRFGARGERRAFLHEIRHPRTDIAMVSRRQTQVPRERIRRRQESIQRAVLGHPVGVDRFPQPRRLDGGEAELLAEIHILLFERAKTLRSRQGLLSRGLHGVRRSRELTASRADRARTQPQVGLGRMEPVAETSRFVPAHRQLPLRRGLQTSTQFQQKAKVDLVSTTQGSRR